MTVKELRDALSRVMDRDKTAADVEIVHCDGEPGPSQINRLEKHWVAIRLLDLGDDRDGLMADLGCGDESKADAHDTTRFEAPRQAFVMDWDFSIDPRLKGILY